MVTKIKRIIDCKYENGELLYLVKWNPSWESADKLESLFQHAVDDFWDYINYCKHAIEGKFMPPGKKRKIGEAYSPLRQETEAAVTPAKIFPVSSQTPNNQHEAFPQMLSEVASLDTSLVPSLNSLQSQQMSTPPKKTGSQYNRGGRGRGSGRGRGRGSRGGKTKELGAGKFVKQEIDVNMPGYNNSMMNLAGISLQSPFLQTPFPASSSQQITSFGMVPIPSPSVSSSNKIPSLFNTDSLQQDVKPMLSSDGQIVSPTKSYGMNALISPSSVGTTMSPQSSPSTRGRGRGGRSGRGRGGRGGISSPSTAGAPGLAIKEEKAAFDFGSEKLNPSPFHNSNSSGSVAGSADQLQSGFGGGNKGTPAPNLLSGDSQYENWSNLYANLVLVCRVCSREQNPKNRASWKGHYESHLDIKNFGCYHCDKRFRLKGDLKTHVTRVHKQEFLDHMVIRYNDVAEVPAVDPAEAIDGWTNPYVRNVFQCKVCQKELMWKSRNAWKSHFESHTDVKRFGCYVCQKPFRLKGDLKTHITRVHKVEFEEQRVIKLDTQEEAANVPYQLQM